MKWKYMMIFLMGLLCLVSSDNLFSQHCFTMSYDKNGNRINFMSVSCSKDVRGNINDKAEESERYENDHDQDDLMVYPNPNNGIFRIKLKNDEIEDMAEVYVYDNKGVLINSGKFAEETYVDISNNPAGVYLVRIVVEDKERSVIVLKF